MKKVYYKKAESLDRTPIILRLERRHTIDTQLINEDRPLSERSASISSLDQLRSVPTIPRIKSREAAKSFSEDNLSKGEAGVPKKIVTEAELSSSWLYKSMQASINSRFKSPNKSPYRQTDDLAPVKLEDPKMKPIPVNRSRRKSASCFCRVTTLTAISVCTIGFLAAVTGLIYMEVFANKNLTSHESSVTPVDLTEYKLDFPEGYDQLPSSHELDKKMGKGREKIQNPATMDADGKDHAKEKSGASDGMATTRNIGIEKSENIELSQYLNNANAKIKFQDSETVIYEVKSSDSIKLENTAFDGLRGRSFMKFNDTEESVSDAKNVSEMTEKQKFESVETISDSQHGTVKEPIVVDEKGTDNEKKKDVSGDKIVNDPVKTKSEEAKQQDISDTSVKSPESEKSVSETTKDTESLMKPDDDTQSVKVVNVANEIDRKFEDSVDNNLEVELKKQAVETVPFVEYADEDDSIIDKDHNVNLMVEVVDDLEDRDYAFSNRRGDSFLIETTKSTEVNVDSVKPDMSSADLEISQPELPKQPVDIKVSLAEAMKHLQVLDTNNKILSSRTKIGKPKENTKKRKQNNPWNNDVSLERMKYLQKVRQMLYEGFQ